MTKRTCWAQHMGACDEISKEHYFTRGLLPDVEVTISGHPASKGGTVSLPFRALVAKTLCGRHNSALSELDQAAIDFMNASRELLRMQRVRRAQPRREWSPFRLRVDGLRLERWLLKVGLNLTRIQHVEAGGWSPPPDLVEVVFGIRPFPAGAGACVAARLGASLMMGDRVGGALIHGEKEQAPVGLILIVGGIPFVSGWHDDPRLMLPLEIEGEPLDHVIPHMKRLHDASANTFLEFDWSGRWHPQDHRDVVRLRSK